jgi:DNA-binding transcriptional ArsR family regulator
MIDSMIEIKTTLFFAIASRPEIRVLATRRMVLFIKQKELGLESLDLVVLLNMTSHWWFRHRPPFLRTNVIARRTGVSARTIQRVIRKLEEKGYVTRARWRDETGQMRPAIFFDGLIRKLEIMTGDDPMLGERVRKAQSKSVEQLG